MKILLSVLFVFISPQLYAADKAIYMSYQKGDSLPLLAIIAPAMQDGLVNYQQSIGTTKVTNFNKQTHQLCLEMSASATEGQFNQLVSALMNAATSITHFKLTTQAHCNKNLSACFNSKDICSGSAFVGSDGLLEYVTKSQFASALAQVSPAKTQIEMNMNEGTAITGVEMLGLKSSSDNCSLITVSADISTGAANLSCTLKGSVLINNKTLSWLRDPRGYWYCHTDLNAEDKIKYASRCHE